MLPKVGWVILVVCGLGVASDRQLMGYWLISLMQVQLPYTRTWASLGAMSSVRDGSGWYPTLIYPYIDETSLTFTTRHLLTLGFTPYLPLGTSYTSGVLVIKPAK